MDNRRAERKRKRRQERIRHQRHERHYGGSHAFVPNADEGAPSPQFAVSTDPGANCVSERTNRMIEWVSRTRGFANERDLIGFMNQEVVGDGWARWHGRMLADDPREQAQECALLAVEAGSRADSLLHARKALDLDPRNTDARRILACADPGIRQEFFAALESIVLDALQDLGGESFARENRGEFWRRTETRPYIRARYALAQAYQGLDRLEDAIAHYRAIMDLNQDDNLGCREHLLACHLALRQLPEARRVLDRMNADFTAVGSWGRLLYHVLAGEDAEAQNVLKTAERNNPMARRYLLAGQDERPGLPDIYRIGSKEEAIFCALVLGVAWDAHPSAKSWLEIHGKAGRGWLGSLFS